RISSAQRPLASSLSTSSRSRQRYGCSKGGCALRRPLRLPSFASSPSSPRSSYSCPRPQPWFPSAFVTVALVDMTLLSDVVTASNRVAETSSRSAKIANLAELLRRLDPHEVAV